MADSVHSDSQASKLWKFEHEMLSGWTHGPRLIVREDWARCGVSFYVADKRAGMLALGEPLVMKTQEVSAFELPPPTVVLEREQTQDLFEQLWVMGYRPRDGSLSTGQLKATEGHLADMKTIAFHLLKIERK